jgi:hypothetical protein
MAGGCRLDDEWVPKILDSPIIEHIVTSLHSLERVAWPPNAAGVFDHKCENIQLICELQVKEALKKLGRKDIVLRMLTDLATLCSVVGVLPCVGRWEATYLCGRLDALHVGVPCLRLNITDCSSVLEGVCRHRGGCSGKCSGMCAMPFACYHQQQLALCIYRP